jgi:hypothetical protein
MGARPTSIRPVWFAVTVGCNRLLGADSRPRSDARPDDTTFISPQEPPRTQPASRSEIPPARRPPKGRPARTDDFRVRKPKDPARGTLTDVIRPRIPDSGNAYKGRDARRAKPEALRAEPAQAAGSAPPTRDAFGQVLGSRPQESERLSSLIPLTETDSGTRRREDRTWTSHLTCCGSAAGASGALGA